MWRCKASVCVYVCVCMHINIHTHVHIGQGLVNNITNKFKEEGDNKGGKKVI